MLSRVIHHSDASASSTAQTKGLRIRRETDPSFAAESLIEDLKGHFRHYDTEKVRFEASVRALEKHPKYPDTITSHRVAVRHAQAQNSDIECVTRFFHDLLKRPEISNHPQGTNLLNDYVRTIINGEFHVLNSLSSLLFSLERNNSESMLELALASAMISRPQTKESAPPFTDLASHRKLSDEEIVLSRKIIFFYNNNLSEDESNNVSWRKDNPFTHLLSVLEFCDWSGNPKLNQIYLERIDCLRSRAEIFGPQIKFLAKQLLTSVEDELVRGQLELILDTPDPQEQRKHLNLLRQLMGSVLPVVQHSNKPDERFYRQAKIFNDALIAFRGFFDMSAEVETLANDFARHTPGELPLIAQFFSSVSENTSWLYASANRLSPGLTIRAQGLIPEMLFETKDGKPHPKYQTEWTWAGSEVDNFCQISVIASGQFIILTNPNPDLHIKIPDPSSQYGFKAVPYSIVYYKKSDQTQNILSLLVPTQVIDQIATQSSYSILDLEPETKPSTDIAINGFSPEYLYALASKAKLPVVNISTGTNITGFDSGLEALTSPLHSWEGPLAEKEAFFATTYDGHIDKRALQTGTPQIEGQDKDAILANLQDFHTQASQVIKTYRIDSQILLARYAYWKYGQTPKLTTPTSFLEPIPQDLSASRLIYEAYAWHRFHRQQNSARKDFPVLSFHRIGNPKKLSPDITLDTFGMLLSIDGENLALPMPRNIAAYSNEQILHLLTDERVSTAWNAFVITRLEGQMPVFLNRSTFKGDKHG